METIEEVLHIEEVSEPERKCRELYGVEPKIRNWRQYNLGRVEEGWEYWLESKVKEKLGHYKITQPWKKDKQSTLSQQENRCIYWEEYWYNKFDGNRQMELIKYLCKILDTYISISPELPCSFLIEQRYILLQCIHDILHLPFIHVLTQRPGK